MLSDEQLAQIRPRIRQVQYATIGMMMFIAVLAPVVLLSADLKTIFGSPKMLTLIAAIGAIGMFSMAGVLSRIFGIHPPKRGDEKATTRLVNSLSTESLIRVALIEGAVFLNLLVFMLEPNVVSLVVAGIGFLMMLFYFPRVNSVAAKVQKWFED